MSYPSQIGPVPFDITIGDGDVDSYIQLTATTDPPDGTYTMWVGDPVATVTLDENGNITNCTFNNLDRSHFRGHKWATMTGSFDASQNTGSGTITDNDDPTEVDGVWEAGGGGEPTPQSEQKGAHA